MPEISQLEDVRLAREAGKGCREAFTKIYQSHCDAVYSLAFRLLNNASAAEDLSQEVFVKASLNLNAFRADSSLRHWLKRLTANAAIDLIRSNKNVVLTPLDSQEIATEDAPRTIDQIALQEALSKLESPARSLLWLNYVEGWTHIELGQRFGQSESWSKSQISRALKKLRHELGENQLLN